MFSSGSHVPSQLVQSGQNKSQVKEDQNLIFGCHTNTKIKYEQLLRAKTQTSLFNVRGCFTTDLKKNENKSEGPLKFATGAKMSEVDNSN